MKNKLFSETEKMIVHGKLFVQLSPVVEWKADCIPKEFIPVGKGVKNSVLVLCKLLFGKWCEKKKKKRDEFWKQLPSL